jgi:hypothetical protein
VRSAVTQYLVCRAVAVARGRRNSQWPRPEPPILSARLSAKRQSMAAWYVEAAALPAVRSGLPKLLYRRVA